MSWYEDIEEMEHDDAYLQTIYDRLWKELPMEARRRIDGVHCYPSRQCTYTIGKRRIFVRVRDPRDGTLIPECALRYIILHELGPGGIRTYTMPDVSRATHVINPTIGHDSGFRRWFDWLGSWVLNKICREAVPVDFNPC